MTDLEITRLCAEAMAYELEFITTEGPSYYRKRGVCKYYPLHDDAQAMALVKKFRLRISQPGSNNCGWLVHVRNSNGIVTGNLNLNRAICEAVAKMQAAK